MFLAYTEIKDSSNIVSFKSTFAYARLPGFSFWNSTLVSSRTFKGFSRTAKLSWDMCTYIYIYKM